MTTMIIDNRATAEKAYETYTIDRTEWPTEDDLLDLIDDCMNDDVHSVTILEDDVEILKVLNENAPGWRPVQA